MDTVDIDTTVNPIMDMNSIDTTVNKLIESVSRSIKVDCTVRPRSSVNGGTKQLKLKNRTKGTAPWDKKQNRAFRKVTKKIGMQHQANIIKAWKKLRESKTT